MSLNLPYITTKLPVRGKSAPPTIEHFTQVKKTSPALKSPIEPPIVPEELLLISRVK